ncbi:MAG: ABC transporter permease [Pseudohongiellaceae bacterium]
MIKNYLLVTLRTLRRQPGFTAIKVLSLSLGLICSILVLMHVQYTTSYDRHFDNWQNIYRLVTSLTTDQRIDSDQIAEGVFNPLLKDYGQIEQAAKIRSDNGLFTYGEFSSPNDYHWVEPAFLSMFSFDFLRGDRETALDRPNTIVISESAARKYFGDTDPLGETLTLNSRLEVQVTGIYRDLPPNTHLDIEMMIGVATARQVAGESFMNGSTWVGFGGTMAYLVIPGPAAAESLRQDLPNFIDRNVPEQQQSFVRQYEHALDLEPLADIYLSPRQGFGPADYGRRIVLGGLSLFAVLILVSSCINFANLSLAQMQQRGREIGVRKTLGASRGDLLAQFLAEAVLLTMLAFLVALPVVYLLVPPYTALTGTAFTFGSMLQSSQIIWILLFAVTVGLLSGLLPALKMSRYQPIAAISGKRDGGRSSRWFRAGLTVVQFGFAVVVVIFAIGVNLQVKHLKEVDPGFNRGNLIVLDTRYSPSSPNQFGYQAMVDELASHPGIRAVGRADAAPPNNGGYNPWGRPGWEQDELRTISHLGVDEHYLEAMQIELLAGRNFSSDFPADFMPAGQPDPEQTYGVLITTAAVRNFGFASSEAALDELLTVANLTFRIIGVTNEFRLSGGLEDAMRSTSVLRGTDRPTRSLLIRLDPAQRDEALSHIDTVWDRHRPDVPIDRQFYEQIYDSMVREETNGINRASQFAAVLTVLIAALGLYALAFFSTQQRTKEIGIRKVLGASVGSIVKLLTVSFVKPVLLACTIAVFFAWWIADYYLGQFSSRVEIPVLVYISVVAFTVLLAVCTVIVHSTNVATSDPVQSLRDE